MSARGRGGRGRRGRPRGKTTNKVARGHQQQDEEEEDAVINCWQCKFCHLVFLSSSNLCTHLVRDHGRQNFAGDEWDTMEIRRGKPVPIPVPASNLPEKGEEVQTVVKHRRPCENEVKENELSASKKRLVGDDDDGPCEEENDEDEEFSERFNRYRRRAKLFEDAEVAENGQNVSSDQGVNDFGVLNHELSFFNNDGPGDYFVRSFSSSPSFSGGVDTEMMDMAFQEENGEPFNYSDYGVEITEVEVEDEETESDEIVESSSNSNSDGRAGSYETTTSNNEDDAEDIQEGLGDTQNFQDPHVPVPSIGETSTVTEGALGIETDENGVINGNNLGHWCTTGVNSTTAQSFDNLYRCYDCPQVFAKVDRAMNHVVQYKHRIKSVAILPTRERKQVLVTREASASVKLVVKETENPDKGESDDPEVGVSNTALPSGRGRQKSTAYHNKQERDRRGDIAHAFVTIRRLIPGMEKAGRASKVIILGKAVEYIQELKERDQWLLVTKKDAAKRLQSTQQKLLSLVAEVKDMGVDVVCL